MKKPRRHLSFHAGKPNKAFSLLELLVVISVISLVIGMMLPVFKGMTGKAKESQNINNLQALALASRLFAAENNNKFPMDYGGNAPPRRTRGPVAYHVATFRPLFPPAFFADKLTHPQGGGDYLKSSKTLYSPVLRFFAEKAKNLAENELASHDGGLRIGYYAYSYPENGSGNSIPTYQGKSFANQSPLCWGRALLYTDYWGPGANDLGGLESKNMGVAHVDGSVSLRLVATVEKVRIAKGDFATFNYLATGEE